MGQLNYSTDQGEYKHFTERERYKLEGYLEAGISISEIAERLNKHRATVYREINRGRVARLSSELIEYRVYRANVAQRVYESRVSNRERSLKIGKDKELEEYIRKRILKDKRSPDAVIGEIKQKGLRFKGMICTKTLYNYVEKGIFSGISNANLFAESSMGEEKEEEKET